MKTSDASLLQQPRTILLIGPPGGGKTTFALQFPNLWIGNGDNNLAGPLTWLASKKKLTPVFKYDNLSKDDNDEPITMRGGVWMRFKEKFMAALADPTIHTLFIDSLTFLDLPLQEWVCSTQGIKQLEGFHWTHFKKEMVTTIDQCKRYNKTVLVSVHEKPEFDKAGNVVKYVPSISSGLTDYFGYLFSDMWRCSIKDLGGGKLKAIVSTYPNGKIDLKSSLLFGQDEIEAEYATVKAAIEKKTF